MILITGATGQLGRAVVHRLLERVEPTEIAILARDPAKTAALSDKGVSVRIGEYGDVDSLANAIDGAGRVLLIASNEPQHRMQQHQNVIDAALHAGVDLFGFTSRALNDVNTSRNGLMSDYLETEELIRRSGLPCLLFRDALYLDTIPNYVGGPRIFETGIRVPAGEGKVAYALRREMGEAQANAMVDQPGTSKTCVLSGPNAYSFADVARALSEAAGVAVTYTDVRDDEYVRESIECGFPEQVARRTLGFFSDIRDGQLGETSTELATLLGREPADLSEGLREVFDLARGPDDLDNTSVK
jgi:NAD(P)H dehydrogenase (quinone)